ncbi:SigB/SigF/SigG family RNA polymerase sigma factor [Acidiferrimicrobium sp. IK]|uniref:SigB/SigF/SigG family RNA polymerase sigma factor n=1 Tax=Acidiferrimicrobium sp. IK TaxID=2871700 RepID=UPI0021CB51A1|nr:SigB/SigF/SigG family RNA polymerase sigma factor [Acidiferrimicrobium sp. IK]MCU4184884.1 SigB/SigF/SigG family RNA polymerase sigma factor [Acidiferrimicrobium sp. IK]
MVAPAPPNAGREHIRRAIADYSSTRDPRARDTVVAAYQGLAYSLAARFAQRGEELDDLNQVALIGLLKAVDRFDPDRGAELTTFATATILGELKRHLRDRGWSVRLPRRIHDLHLRAQQSIDELTQELGRSPTLAEIAARIECPVEDVVEALDAGGFRHNASLEAPLSPGEDTSLTSRLGTGDQNLAEVDGRVTLSPLLARLPERQRQILNLRFVVGCSQTEIASMVGVSQMQVSRLLSRSLTQLRAWAVEPA